MSDYIHTHPYSAWLRPALGAFAPHPTAGHPNDNAAEAFISQFSMRAICVAQKHAIQSNE